ncbi:MAG TPA: nucleotidyltransferase family protein [Pyrinomonadaceae bacterium]|nr:nucleotidyltransferase family protein [Pyrinomonadaceae bacterium]
MKVVAAILLAAGRSRRMGAFKPLLPFGDSTVIDSCIDNLHEAALDEIIVVVGHRADELQAHLKDANLKFAFNVDPNSEMGVSIARGVEQMSDDADALLIALVDHPAVSGDTIKTIIDAWVDGAQFVQPEFNGRGGHPVLIDLSFRNELLNLDPEKGLRKLFEAHRDQVKRLTVDSPFVARDMDTWEDYVQLHLDAFGQPPSTV